MKCKIEICLEITSDIEQMTKFDNKLFVDNLINKMSNNEMVDHLSTYLRINGYIGRSMIDIKVKSIERIKAATIHDQQILNIDKNQTTELEEL